MNRSDTNIDILSIHVDGPKASVCFRLPNSPIFQLMWTLDSSIWEGRLTIGRSDRVWKAAQPPYRYSALLTPSLLTHLHHAVWDVPPREPSAPIREKLSPALSDTHLSLLCSERLDDLFPAQPLGPAFESSCQGEVTSRLFHPTELPDLLRDPSPSLATWMGTDDEGDDAMSPPSLQMSPLPSEWEGFT